MKLIKYIIILLQFSIVTAQTPIGKDILNENLTSFNNILESFSNVNGTVDYSSIRNDPFNLDKFLSFISSVSPENHPELFQKDDSKAYWINVYNALAIKTIIDNPNISSIRDVSWGMGAFWRTKFMVGGRKMTLNHIEHKILRGKYKDPRIHFAINCASTSCPPIGNRIVTGNGLDEQLDNKALDFINDKSNVSFDHKNEIVHLSRIFKWFKKDFVSENRQLIDYILEYQKDINSIQKDKISNNYKIEFFKYDWSLND